MSSKTFEFDYHPSPPFLTKKSEKLRDSEEEEDIILFGGHGGV